tara:strand:- start:739 stop:951 length:213 start_codon:yes stop_codon:yes gene_type:complete
LQEPDIQICLPEQLERFSSVNGAAGMGCTADGDPPISAIHGSGSTTADEGKRLKWFLSRSDESLKPGLTG